MRICHFTSTFLPRVGGVEMVVSNLARCQHELGHEALVITPKIRGIDNRVSVPYRVIHYSRPSSKRYLTRQVMLRLLYEHFKRPFDVLHCHSAYPHGYVAATFSRLTGVPVFITPHGPTDIMRKERIRSHPKLEQRLRRGLQEAAGITAISKNIFKEIVSVGGFTEEKVHIVPNGVSLGDFKEVEPFVGDQPYVLAMGRMVAQKGFDQLLAAFAEIADKVPDLQLYMAGEGILRRDYEKMTRQLGLEERVHFLGLVQGAQKIAFLKGARFFVCPSRFEPFGIVVLEALAAGIPVIANRVGGIPDIIENNVHGLLVDAESTVELGKAIMDLYKSPRACKEMSVNALERASEFDWMNVTKRYLEVYEKGKILFEEERRESEETPSQIPTT
ncbi:MAG: glycosyltransferase family 4 protein [Candidatus Omnitrophica bacterium]|nr:glycosyltransferase family 4 protein [Candidatus Omnitrophota bacterium]MCA9436265.1 glycosyltransferase family 4 protein [Candidatus Omnitrophota bacterium]MCA9447877.1 glycosyltransferase family 4 protein [Candidatus Omnitrophota bacterium]MCB9769506.1 glycosyltransferase family 4 protein [Candidatus Omnitrophota bacterium]MCB9783589.1 glycosyltransferase family 4 protein [Candidatus Omnitrophota bacterium]